MTEALLSSTIQNLEKWGVVKPGFSFPCNKDSFIKVVNNLRMIVDFLRDKNLGKTSCGLKYLISDVIEIALDLDEGYLRYEMESIERWLGEVTMRMLEFGVDGAESEMRSENVGEGDHDKDVVGLEEEVELLLSFLIFNGKQWLETLLITGIVGMGKTTLARQLYNHAAVIERFEHRAWVCVSNLSIKEVLMKLIHQVVDCDQLERDSLTDKMECADNQSLQQMLHQRLDGMRYFIVLDDMPKAMRMKYILKALPNEGKGSKLLVTSPSYIEDIFNIHQKKTLDCDKSWQLFLKTIYCGNKLTSEDIFPKQLEKKGQEMLASSCGGLPLAIKNVARQIAEKRQLGSEWEHLLQSFDLSETLESLELFYHKLDPKVKLSFLHLAFFKENAPMREEKFTHICGPGERWSESKAALLVRDSIIGVKGTTSFYGIKSYQINAMLHKLSIQKAKEEIGFEILRNTGNSPPSQTNPCHRVIICSREKFNYTTNQDSYLVSLFFRGGGFFDTSPSYWKSFELLKILDLEDFGLKTLPKAIGTLVELRYLGLRNNYLQDLPDSLGCLKKLKVLDMALNFMVEVPDIVWEMDSLRHLYMSDVIFRKPLKIDALENLETLTYISVDDWTYELFGLQTLTSLRRLGIEELDGNLDVSKFFSALVKLEDLEHLILRGFRFRSMPCLDELHILHNLDTLKLDGLLPRLPCADNFPPNLSRLKLVNSYLDEDPMPVLEKLPYLQKLKLRNAYTGQQMVISHNGFSELEFMVIEEFQNLRNVQFGEDAMFKLEILEIRNCPNFKMLPKEIGSLAYLKRLSMATTKNIAAKIHNYVQQSGLISSIRFVAISCIT